MQRPAAQMLKKRRLEYWGELNREKKIIRDILSHELLFKTLWIEEEVYEIYENENIVLIWKGLSGIIIIGKVRPKFDSLYNQEYLNSFPKLMNSYKKNKSSRLKYLYDHFDANDILDCILSFFYGATHPIDAFIDLTTVSKFRNRKHGFLSKPYLKANGIIKVYSLFHHALPATRDNYNVNNDVLRYAEKRQMRELFTGIDSGIHAHHTLFTQYHQWNQYIWSFTIFNLDVLRAEIKLSDEEDHVLMLIKNFITPRFTFK